MSNCILECEDLRKGYISHGQALPVLDGIFFALKKGEICIITGKSGTGKSTLLGLLGGLERKSAGKIRFEGQDFDSMSDEQLALLRKMKIGFIFQNLNLISSWTAYENVEAALMHSQFDATKRRGIIMPLLSSLEIAHLCEHLPSELSQGQQQRVAIARALVNEPSLILADEPTGDLDRETAREIIELLLTASHKNTTILVATHGAFPLEVADRVLQLSDGQLKQIA